MILVTHDQTEAMTLATVVRARSGAGDAGQAPMDLYQRPTHRFVGDFIGMPGMTLSSENSLAKGLCSSRSRLKAGWRLACRSAAKRGHLPERRLCWVFGRRMCAWPKTVPASR